MSAVFPITEDSRHRLISLADAQVDVSITFPWQDDDDIIVVRIAADTTRATLTLGDDYSLDGAGEVGGGTLTLVDEGVSGEQLEIYGAIVLARTSSIVRNGKYDSKATDDDLDRMILGLQEIRRDLQAAGVGVGLVTGVPSGGTPGQFLGKIGSGDGDTGWVDAPVGSVERTVLAEDATYHAIDYPSPGGVDGGTGTGTSLDPFVGPQFALDWLQKNIDTAGYDVRLEIDSDIATENAPNGFNALFVDYEPLFGAGGLLTIANGGSHKTVCSTSGVGVISYAPNLVLESFDFDGSDDGVFFEHVVAAAGEVDTFNCRYGKAGTAPHINVATPLAAVSESGATEEYGSATAHVEHEAGGTFSSGADHTLTGTPNFALAFVYAVSLGPANISFTGTFTGPATGKRYVGQTGTTIFSANTLPGDADGILDQTSSYNSAFGGVAISAPATASSPGTAGQVAYDSDYVYVCVATDTWMRAAISTW